MTREVRDIPPTPRPVRWATVVWCRWPLGLLALAMAVYGGLIALMLFWAAGGKARDDAQLADAEEAGQIVVVTATIDQVEPVARLFDATPAEHIHYSFPFQNSSVPGSVFAPEGLYVVGTSVEVGHLPDRAETNRIPHTRISLNGDFVTPVLRFVVLPGAVLLLVWLGSVIALRRTMQAGDAAVAELTHLARVRWVIPVMYRAHYRFRDHRACWRHGHHWVRAHSAVGEKLAALPTRAIVIHDRARPQHSRLATVADFARAGQGHPEGHATEPV